MAVQSTEATEPKKRKHPPTFRHLPRERAQKLKKSWVEKKKLKVRWRAQKRKEGLDSGWPDRSKRSLPSQDSPDSESENDAETHGNRKGIPHDDMESEASSSSVDRSDAESERPPLKRKKAQITVPRVDEPESRHLSKKSKGKQPSRPAPLTEVNAGNPDEDKTSLRDLTRAAYSPSSLHTHKADPLHRRKGAVTGTSNQSLPSHSNRNGPAQSSQRSGRGKRDNSSRGGGREQQIRGQPNMKLRMEAMLERIKRDYS